MYKIILFALFACSLLGCYDSSKDLTASEFMLQYNKVKKECSRIEFLDFVTYECKDTKDNMTFKIEKKQWVVRSYTRSGASVIWGIKTTFIEAPEETKW